MTMEQPTNQQQEEALQSRRSILTSIALFPLLTFSSRVALGSTSDFRVQETGASGTAPLSKERYTALAAAYAEAYNLHDLKRAVSFFAENALLKVNGRSFKGHQAIAAFLTEYGAATEKTSLANARMMPDSSYFTGDALLVEGRLVGRHQGELSGFRPSGFNTAIVFASFYRFDAQGRCISADVTMNWGAFFGIS